DGVVGAEEARRILSRLARGSDPNVRIKALDSLQKLEATTKKSSYKGDLQRNRPDLFYAQWLEILGPERGPAVVSLLGWYAGPLGKGIEAFCLAPFLDELAPHLAQDWPDIWRFLCNNIPQNDWERKCFPEAADKPRKPISEIVASVKAYYENWD